MQSNLMIDIEQITVRVTVDSLSIQERIIVVNFFGNQFIDAIDELTRIFEKNVKESKNNENASIKGLDEFNNLIGSLRANTPIEDFYEADNEKDKKKIIEDMEEIIKNVNALKEKIPSLTDPQKFLRLILKLVDLIICVTPGATAALREELL